MPTLLNIDGFKFFFYSNEHLPKHIHISKGEDYAKFDLESMKFTINYFSNSDTKNIIKIIEQNRDFFIRRWNEYFNQR